MFFNEPNRTSVKADKAKGNDREARDQANPHVITKKRFRSWKDTKHKDHPDCSTKNQILACKRIHRVHALSY